MGKEAATWVQAHEDTLASTYVAKGMGKGTTNGTDTGFKAQPRSTLAAEVVNWLGAAKPPVPGGFIKPVTAAAVGLDEGGNQIVNVFWLLLKDARYEKW